MPVHFTVTAGTEADCSQAHELIKSMKAECLVADRGYDTDEILHEIETQGMQAVIPPKKNRKVQREYDRCVYENRNKIERSFLKIKSWRGIATRYAKTTASYIAAVQICCLFMWLRIS